VCRKCAVTRWPSDWGKVAFGVGSKCLPSGVKEPLKSCSPWPKRMFAYTQTYARLGSKRKRFPDHVARLYGARLRHSCGIVFGNIAATILTDTQVVRLQNGYDGIVSSIIRVLHQFGRCLLSGQTLNSSDISLVFPVFDLKFAKLLNKTILLRLKSCTDITMTEIIVIC